jgi:hypothetical protein
VVLSSWSLRKLDWSSSLFVSEMFGFAIADSIDLMSALSKAMCSWRILIDSAG